MNWPKSQQLLADNSRLIPGGLASLNRKADPVIAFVRAKGSRLWDIDGHEYIDYHAGFAPYILGHGDPDIAAAVIATVQSDVSNYGSGPTQEEGELARLFLKAIPHADKVQFFNTGSEATSQAIRVARAWTGRSHLIKMQGGYNGHHNAVATNLMTSQEQLGGVAIHGDEYPCVPFTAGIPPEEKALTHAVPFNDLAAVEQMAKKYEIAALITEPALQNIGVVKPQPGYLESLRELADRYGFLLILDEVKTGFRASLGGYQGLAGVTADLSTYGKAFANGFPIAALAGKAKYLDLAAIADLQKRVLVAGTYNCHPVPVSAAIACLKKLMDPHHDVYGKLERLAQRLEAGQREIFARHDVPVFISRLGSASCVYFTSHGEPRDWWDVLEHHDAAFDTRYRRALIERGIYHFPVIVKQGSISFAHSETDIDQTLEATDDALRELTQGARVLSPRCGMKLIRFGPRGAEKPGLLAADGQRKDCSAHFADWDRAFFQNGGLAKLRDLGDLPDAPADARWGAPVARPGKVIGIGLNYSDHAAESGMPIPSEPIVFMKATNTVCGPHDPILIPRGSEKTDWEVELGVVIGREARYLASPDEAKQFIAGYCISHDVSERAFQLERGGQWTKGKSADNFNPLGPWLATADEIANPDDLAMTLEVNGVRKQSGNTATMIFSSYFLVHYLSQFMTLEAGDVITTGTPPGVGLGQKPPQYLRAGDNVTLSIAGLGSQQSKCLPTP